VSADPEADDSGTYGEDDGYCWFVWYVDELGPGGEATIDITLSPNHTTGTARNCNHGVALNVDIPLVGVPAYGAYWEDVYAPDRCVSFGQPVRHRTSTPTAMPTEEPSPPPTATLAPPPAPTATPSGGAGPVIAPPSTGEGASGHGGPVVWLWVLSAATATAGTGWLLHRRVRPR